MQTSVCTIDLQRRHVTLAFFCVACMASVNYCMDRVTSTSDGCVYDLTSNRACVGELLRLNDYHCEIPEKSLRSNSYSVCEILFLTLRSCCRCCCCCCCRTDTAFTQRAHDAYMRCEFSYFISVSMQKTRFGSTRFGFSDRNVETAPTKNHLCGQTIKRRWSLYVMI